MGAPRPRRRLGVLGWPVAHSRSPAMQEAALAEAGLAGWTYQRLPVPPELFAETVRALPEAGFAGANVTIPHKEAALAVADTASDDARAIGAANTLRFGDDGSIHATNTDAPGLLAALPLDPAGRRALVLGAGGSARACAYALRQAGAEVEVWNRTPARAAELAADLGVRAVESPGPAAILVHCTSTGLDAHDDTFKRLPLSADGLDEYTCVVDLVYRAGDETTLIREARRRGAAVVDGLEILVRQGALSFRSWTGRDPSLDAMRRAARGSPTPPNVDRSHPPSQPA